MAVSEFVAADAPAQALALILSADGSVSKRASGWLDELGAFDLLGVDRERFSEMARHCSRQIAPGLSQRSWLSEEDIGRTEALLDTVCQASDRVLVCRLAAAAMEDDGLVTHGARQMLNHALAHWRIDQATLSQPTRTGRTT